MLLGGKADWNWRTDIKSVYSVTLLLLSATVQWSVTQSQQNTIRFNSIRASVYTIHSEENLRIVSCALRVPSVFGLHLVINKQQSLPGLSVFDTCFLSLTELQRVK